jgi:hypothetical protein
MARQLVRLNEVRSPIYTADTYTSAQVQAAEATSRTAEDYLQYVLSQIRLLQGTASWKTLPASNVTQIGTAVGALQMQAGRIGAVASQVADLAQSLQALQATAATQQQLASAAADLAQLTAQVQSLVSTTAQLASQVQNAVSAQGLQNAIRQAQVFDQPLQGLRNRYNRSFTTPANFVLGTIRVLLNGQRLYPGAANDYTVGRAALATGYNQVTLSNNQAAPGVGDLLTADYIPA